MTISKTEMLEAFDRINYEITEVLFSWVEKEANNLNGYIENPSSHVDYNPYVIPDYTKLQVRLDLLKNIAKALYDITEYKKGNPDYTRSMYEAGIEDVHIAVLMRLHQWLIKRYADMTEVISKKDDESKYVPLEDYSSMVTFNVSKFMTEYTMYYEAIEGSRIVIEYKKQETPPAEASVGMLSNEPPLSGNGGL